MTIAHCTQNYKGLDSVAYLCLGVKLRSRKDLDWDLDLDWTKVLGSSSGQILVSLLELVVPLVEVNVENDDGTSCQASHQEFLVMWESKTSYAGVTGRESVEQSQIESSPHLDNALVSSSHHVLTVSRNEHALDVVGVKLIAKPLAVDGEDSEVMGGVARDNNALPTEAEGGGRGELCSTFQCPE